MNKPITDIRGNVVDIARPLIAASVTGTSLIRHLKGAHPIEIKSALISAGELDLAERAFKDISVAPPCLHEISSEDNPILSFWPFADTSALDVAQMASRFSSVALLGAPTLFSAMRRQRHSNEIYLFDCDDYLFREETVSGFVRCNIASAVPAKFNNKFDLVIGDPPWYLEEYLLWLATAERIVRPGGTIMFSLFPEGIRDSAGADKRAILSTAERIFAEFSVLDSAIEYDVPSFEQVQMIRAGIKPVRWRYAHLIVGRIRMDKKLRAIRPNDGLERWIERRIGNGRLFIKLGRSLIEQDDFLQTAESKSPFLSSPSRRNPSRLRANVMSSRGHGLSCSNPALLAEMVDNIKSGDDIEIQGGGLDDSSRRLFKVLGFDLWPKFIQL
ncbi:MAG TPA: hypothetical protein VG291_00275 [Xanthobacteraceae bacterium]|jgi:hypothetical protein|nr:hypothetical protein [Xanthobacteraceae bacterium]